MSNKCCRCWVTCGAILLGLGVIVGAVAAHGLDERLQEVHGDKPVIERLGGPITAAAKALDDIRVGVRYHVWHALGMIAVGLAGSLAGTRNWPLQAAGICFGLGIIGFSGGLYALAITEIKILGAITPIGGLAFLGGWAALMIAGFSSSSNG